MRHLYILTFVFVIAILVGCDNKSKQPKSDSTESENGSIVKLSSTRATEQLMKEDDFWKIIEDSRTASDNNYQKQITSLKKILTTLDTTQIVKFDSIFAALLAISNDYKLWGASYVINGGCSDDCFEYFREYLIAHGKDKFYETLQDPETCVSWIKSEEEDNWEGIRYSAAEVYKQKTGRDIPKTYQSKDELKGKPFDEATVDKQYPKLAKKFFGKRHDEE